MQGPAEGIQGAKRSIDALSEVMSIVKRGHLRVFDRQSSSRRGDRCRKVLVRGGLVALGLKRIHPHGRKEQHHSSLIEGTARVRKG